MPCIELESGLLKVQATIFAALKAELPSGWTRSSQSIEGQTIEKLATTHDNFDIILERQELVVPTYQLQARTIDLSVVAEGFDFVTGKVVSVKKEESEMILRSPGQASSSSRGGERFSLKVVRNGQELGVTDDERVEAIFKEVITRLEEPPLFETTVEVSQVSQEESDRRRAAQADAQRRMRLLNNHRNQQLRIRN